MSAFARESWVSAVGIFALPGPPGGGAGQRLVGAINHASGAWLSGPPRQQRPHPLSAVVPIDLWAELIERLGPMRLTMERNMKRLVIAAILCAFGAAVVLPAAAVISSEGAFAAQKSGKTAKKATKKAPKKKTTPSM